MSSRCLLVLASTIIVLASVSPAAAQLLVLRPGNEALFSELLGGEPGGCSFTRASIEEDHVVASYLCDEEPVTVTLRHPSTAMTAAGTAAFVVESDNAPRALLEALRLRLDEAPDLWFEPTSGPHDSGQLPATPLVRRWLSFALLALVVFMTIFRIVQTRRTPPRPQLMAALFIVGLFACSACLIADWGSLHPHNSFLARSDCAIDSSCDTDRPGWLPPAYHVYETILSSTFPGFYRHSTLSAVSLALTIIALLVQWLFLRRLFVRFSLPRAESTALLALAITASHPGLIRVSVATTFWPAALLLLWASGWWLLETFDEARRVPKQVAAVAAMSAACLAFTSSVAFLIVAPVVLLAPLLWRAKRTSTAPVVVVACAALVLGFVAFYGIPFMNQAVQVGSALTDRGPLELIAWNLWADSRSTPTVLALISLVGLMTLARHWRMGAPLIMLFLIQFALAHRLEAVFPTAFLHGYATIFVLSPWAAAGVVALIELSEKLVGPHRANKARLVAVLALFSSLTIGWGSATESWTLLNVERPLAEEVDEIEIAFDRLPPHRWLVVPPAIYSPLKSIRWDGDPIEARFPAGLYRAAMLRRGLNPAPIVPLDRWVAIEAPQTEDTLVYLGSTLFTFDPSEIVSNKLPANLERPMLTDALHQFELEPLVLFEISTTNHPFSRMRLGADRRRTVELGFHRPFAVSR